MEGNLERHQLQYLYMVSSTSISEELEARCVTTERLYVEFCTLHVFLCAFDISMDILANHILL